MGFEHLPQRARCATGKVLNRAGNLIYVALADRSPVGGKLAGRRLGHTGCGEALDERLVVDGYGLDRPAGYLAQQRRHVALAERFWPGDVVRSVLVAFGGQNRRRRGAVLARDVGDSPVPAVMDELASGDRLRAGRNLIPGVEGVAQRTPRETTLAQRLFGVPVTWSDCGRVLLNRVEVGRVGYVTHACLPGRFDGGAVLGRATAKVVGADQKQLLSACECLGERLRPVEVGLPDPHPALGQVRKRLGPARREDDLRGPHAIQYQFGGQTTELARCSGDDDAHSVCLSFKVWCQTAA